MSEPLRPARRIVDDPAPDDGALEANLGSVTDEQWLAGHRALLASGDIPAAELGYLYDPDRDPADVDPSELTPDRDPAEPDEVTTDG